jgi:outer membrane lipoprotein carrier protein
MKFFTQAIAAAVLLSGLVLPPAHAGVAMERLQTFFKQVRSLRGDFSQTTFDEHNHISQRAQGSFAIQRPGRFYWNYTSPYQQLIVANNKKVWLYDSELEQVTVKRLDEAAGNAPAQLLSSGDDLERDFTITEIGAVGDLQWVELTPRDKNTSFKQIRLGFDQHNLRTMELMDNFGHTTRLEFSHVQRNPKLAASLFEFTPPPGVDVIGDSKPLE